MTKMTQQISMNRRMRRRILQKIGRRRAAGGNAVVIVLAAAAGRYHTVVKVDGKRMDSGSVWTQKWHQVVGNSGSKSVQVVGKEGQDTKITYFSNEVDGKDQKVVFDWSWTEFRPLPLDWSVAHCNSLQRCSIFSAVRKLYKAKIPPKDEAKIIQHYLLVYDPTKYGALANFAHHSSILRCVEIDPRDVAYISSKVEYPGKTAAERQACVEYQFGGLRNRETGEFKGGVTWRPWFGQNFLDSWKPSKMFKIGDKVSIDISAWMLVAGVFHHEPTNDARDSFRFLTSDKIWQRIQDTVKDKEKKTYSMRNRNPKPGKKGENCNLFTEQVLLLHAALTSANFQYLKQLESLYLENVLAISHKTTMGNIGAFLGLCSVGRHQELAKFYFQNENTALYKLRELKRGMLMSPKIRNRMAFLKDMI